METSNQALTDTLAELRARIERIRRRKESIGEQNTKAVLIEPLLSALGWNLRDLDDVIREYKYKPPDNPVDYALFILRSPCLFIEAKDLGTRLDDRKWVSQILGYATVVGIEWCVLTDGDEYRLYNAHAPVEVEEKLFRAVRISDLSQEEYTRNTLDLLSKDNMKDKRIDALWNAHFVDCRVKIALEELLSDENRTLVNWLHRKREELSPSEIRESLQRADIHVDFPISPISSPPGHDKLSRKRPEGPRSHRVVAVKVSVLIEEGLIRPPLQLEKLFKGHRLTATIQQDGAIVFDGRAYTSLSTAGGMARKSIIGAPPDREYPQTNGWTFWKYRDPETRELREIDFLRQEYLKK